MVSWLYSSEQGKERVRHWLQSHPDAHVKIDSYDVLDTDATEGRASVVVRGKPVPRRTTASRWRWPASAAR
ncbi:hypothetical protein Atai01_11440 [Amycolatopsis taiwanensis]|uniref:Uncharacterized protein n=1 Tax=Amycolatopsis taiwanensis TaxID=342230 RepID=A0A9W6QYY0_9PSEU|nr:hypothetical protein Atai01_11440 [Amycolatopsis taiwanensis]